MIYTEINKNEFVDSFKNNEARKYQFSYDALLILYDYYEELSEEEDISLDVVAICCEFTEYENIEQYLKDYNTDLDLEDYDTKEDYLEAVKKEIEDKTLLLDIDGTSFLIAQY